MPKLRALTTALVAASSSSQPAPRVAAANQPRARLRMVLPCAAGLFRDLESAINLAFLNRFDTQDKVDWLTPKRLTEWLSKQGYSGRVDLTMLHQRILTAPRGATDTHGTDQAHITASYVAMLPTLIEQIKALNSRSSASSPHMPTPTSPPPCPGPGPRPGRWPRSATAAPDSRAHRSPARPGRTLDPPIRETARRRIPMDLRRTTARRPHRLRRRYPPGQPLGRRPLQPRHRTRPRPPRAVRVLARAWLHIIWHC